MAGIHIQLASRGYAIFPIKKNAKNPPLVKWREESTDNLDQIKAWEKKYPGCNWGLDTGKSGLVALDIDKHGENNGFVTLEQLRVEKGYELPKTLVFETPSGGQHYVYKGKCKTTAGVIGTGLDTRGLGGYIVIPGSSIDGVPYKVHQKSPVAPAPEWIAILADRGSSNVERVQVDVELDGDQSLRDARRYLSDPNRARPSIDGEGGLDNAFRVACNAKDYGISEAVCLDLMLEVWNPTCIPPWTPEEIGQLQQTVSNAYEYGQNSPGARSASAVFEAPVESSLPQNSGQSSGSQELPVEKRGRLLPMMDLTEAMSPAPPQKWLIDGWIPHNEMSLMTGKPGTGKSLLALQLALSAAYGLDWLGHKLERSYKVLYLSCEDDRDEIKRRCRAIGRLPEYAFLEGGVDPKIFRPVPLVGEDNAMVHENKWKLEAGALYLDLNFTLNDLGWFEPLIILDTLSDMYMANENNRAMVNHFVKSYLGRIRTDYQATIVTLAHPAKSEGSDYSGNTAWEGSHRALMKVSQHESQALPDHRMIKLTKGNRTTTHGKQFFVEWRAGAFHRVSGSDIPELEILALEQDIEIVYGRIVQAADQGDPVSDAPQGARYLGKETIFDCEDRMMTVDTKMRIAGILKEQGRIVRGRVGSHDNKRRGLVPVPEASEVFDDDE